MHFWPSRFYSYNLLTKECQKVEINTIKVNNYETIATNDGRYIIVFQAIRISMFDLDLLKFLGSVAIPDYDFDIGRSCIKSNKEVAQIITNGYIREFCHHKEFPADIVRVISQFTAEETIFMMGNGKIWSVDVGEIISMCN